MARRAGVDQSIPRFWPARSPPSSTSTLNGATPLDALLGRLKHQELLLLLDNCEHLIAAVAALVEAVLGACPKVRVLRAPRNPWDRRRAVFRLSSLSLPEDDRVGPEMAMEPARSACSSSARRRSMRASSSMRARRRP